MVRLVPRGHLTARTQPTGPSSSRRLPLLATSRDAFETGRYRKAPDDWALAVTDIVDSTGAIAKGRHKTVNFVAAMGIAALRNLCAPNRIPFLFGGDGAVVMVPAEFATRARTELARVRGLAARDFELQMRVGLVAVSELRRLGRDVLVGRYEPTPGNSFGRLSRRRRSACWKTPSVAGAATSWRRLPTCRSRSTTALPSISRGSRVAGTRCSRPTGPCSP
jgi:hypothetical protein